MQVSMSEAAALLGLRSRSTLYRLKDDGLLAASNYLRGSRIELEPPGLPPFRQWAETAINRNKGPRRQSEVATPDGDGDGIPPYAESRARAEAERARLLELERLEREGVLIYRETAEAAFAQAVAIAKTRLLGVPMRAKAAIPGLDVADVETIHDLIREALEEVASGALLPQASAD